VEISGKQGPVISGLRASNFVSVVAPPHFFIAVARDDFRFLLVELGEFRPRGVVDAQQLILRASGRRAR
jgi:hypothetical protein